MPLRDFWPAQQNVNQCIRVEAETLSDAVFLAVHRPMRFIRRALHGAEELKVFSQDQLLKQFLSPDLPSGILLMPILGGAGVGKSHAVRWLDIRLRRHKQAASFHIIRIPKSSSLKQVIGLILQDLPDAEYGDLKSELVRARSQIDALEAREQLKAKLIVALQRRYEAAMSRAVEARARGQKPDPADLISHAHCAPGQLQALLNDPTLYGHFMGSTGVIARLARGITENMSREREQDRGFVDADLRIPDSINRNDLADKTRAYVRLLDRDQGVERRQALAELNAVIDDALYQLLNTGETRLPEILAEVRRRLLREQKELVLLIEDFAAMAGIQGALLDVVKQEAERDGNRKLCNMRTAMALTEGYLGGKDTMASRAIYEWRIEAPAGEAQTLAAVVDFAGAYLNAARFGQAELGRWHAEGGGQDSDKSPIFDAESLDAADAAAIEAFGHSSQRHALFPFNRAAIEQMTRSRFEKHGAIEFNPRDIINYILRDLLLNQREDFAAGRFPTPEFRAAAHRDLDANLVAEINRTFSDRTLVDRYLGLLRFWGDRPARLRDVRLPKAVYQAFKLTPLETGSKDVQPEPLVAGGTGTGKDEVKPDLRPRPPEPVVPEPQPEPRVTPPVTELQYPLFDVLDAWSRGQEIMQNQANALRGLIAEAAAGAIDWEQELFTKIDVTDTYYKTRVYIPRARGGAPTLTPDNAMIRLCSESDLADPVKVAQLVRTLRAVIRYHYHKSWNYDRADEDLPLYGNFVERAAASALAFVRTRYFEGEVDYVPLLSQALLLGARVLDLPQAAVRDDAASLAAMFSKRDPDAQPLPQGDDRWSNLRQSCATHRADLVTQLCSLVSARQGQGRETHAVDAAVLLDAVDALKETWRFTKILPDASKVGNFPQLLVEHMRALRGQLDPALNERKQSLSGQYASILEAFGADFDKNEAITLMTSTIDQAMKSGVLKSVQMDIQPLREQIQSLRDLPVRETLSHMARIDQDTDPGAIITSLARAHEKVLDVTADLVETYENFLTEARRVAGAFIGSVDGNVFDHVRAGVREELDALAATAGELNAAR